LVPRMVESISGSLDGAQNGVLTQLNDLWLKAAPKDAKREVGQRVNEVKVKVEEAVDATLTAFKVAHHSADSLQSVSTSRFPAFAVPSERSILSSRR